MAEHELNKIVDDDGEVFNLRDSTKQPTADRVTAWGSTPSDTKYPSEKLVKDSLDAKVSAREEQVATVQDLIQSVRVKPGGSVGSAQLTSASTVSGFSIPSAWYNYIWVPHRDGSASGDNQKYGTLILTPLTNTPDVYVIEGGALTGSSPTYKAIKLASNTDARTISQDVSKGANLVVNGSGRMSSNYNFSGFTYLPTICYNGSAGSFGFNGQNCNDEFISCDFNKKIVISADIRNLVAQPSNCTHRIYVNEYDIDKKTISAPYVLFGVGTLTELTQDLNPGDTVVHLADLSNENWLSTPTHHRGFIFWNYQNSYGYLYPPETYSRNVYPSSDNSVLWDVANVNVSAGTITLNSAWTGPAIPAGTKVSRRRSGGMFPYPASITTGDTAWHSLKGYVKGIVEPGTAERVSTKFSQGTAFIKVGMYPTNMSNTDETTGKKAVVTNLAVYEEQDINDAVGTLPIANGGTGATTAIGAEYNILNQVADGAPSSLDDDRKIALCNQTKSASNGVFRWTKLSYFWTYFKDKISSVLGLTATSYGGNAATATAAQSGSALETAINGKAPNAPSEVTIANGDKVIIADSSDSNKVKRASVAFDGSTTTKALSQKGTFETFLTSHQSITGKMNTDASNAVAPSSSGTGATATLLNNLTSTGLDDISSDSVCIPTTNSDGSDTSKWYKRPLSKLWPWIISHPQVNIIKDGVDAYVRVGEDSTKGIALSYDDTGSTPNMGIWVRWASGSGNGKYMCSCDTSGNCTFNGTASGSLNKDASNAITGDGTGTAPTLLGGMEEGTSIVTSGNVYIPTSDSAGTADGKWYKRKLSKIADFITGKGLDGTQITDGLYINGMSYGDRVSINSGYVYGWKIGSMSNDAKYANNNFKALVVISDWVQMEDFHCNDFVGVLDIGSRMNSSTVSTSNWKLIGRLTSVLPQKTSGANDQRGWAVFCKTNSSTYKSEWYIGKNSLSANMNIGFRYSKITLFPLFEYGWTRELVRETTGNMVFNSGKDDWWSQHLSPTIASTTYSLGNAYNPIYIDSDKRFQACTSVAKITDIGNAASSHINVRWKDSSVGSEFTHFACFRTAQKSPDGTTPAATICDIPLAEAKKRILHSTYGTAVGSSSLPVYVDSSGNVTAVGSKMELPAATESWVKVQQTNGATAYLDSESNKGGVWVSNGGVSDWICYRDNAGKAYFRGDADTVDGVHIAIGSYTGRTDTIYFY